MKSLMALAIALLSASGQALAFGGAASDEIRIQSCWSGDSSSCMQAARAFFSGDAAVKIRALAARQYYEYACILKEPSGCSKVGYLYAVAYDKDFGKAMEFSLKGCNADDGEGCFNAGFLLENALGVAQDLPKAKKFYDKACTFGYKLGCRFALRLKDKF